MATTAVASSSSGSSSSSSSSVEMLAIRTEAGRIAALGCCDYAAYAAFELLMNDQPDSSKYWYVALSLSQAQPASRHCF